MRKRLMTMVGIATLAAFVTLPAEMLAQMNLNWVASA